ncbi:MULTISPECIES: HD-GYP domain-containing protein [Pseudoalteromonas]|uniref:HD-GYP domain-containing protein n=1 Tax=Pseudoalteromonas fuliginea TaxID=1872678 RepID=A0ABQ6RH95_9GAMM|nr:MULTISPECIES: HD-GYP domain-containing protein [Pseudoalteromonas]KAA1155748.1 HD-GYP domain-containing protein [Pseudoalteromonas fuliginea]KAA1167075.1 HD-GYP domain-containing protein [Pseudoalteromonas fuliginea]MDQ2043109.1 HD-GYP domain-containing protein [Pseudoalteromonas sp. 20-92]
MKTILISQLLPGMFVQHVTKQTGRIKVKSQGWVKTQADIDKLKKAGILEVEIDPDKTLVNTVPEKELESTSAVKIKRDPWQKAHSAEQEMGKAKKLYDEAKTLQLKAFKEIKAGRKIDIAPFRELASGFMDSVFRNQDALACLTQMRQKDAYLLEHSINVSILMSIFAKHLEIDKEIIEQLTTGALLHDIGKIKIPDEILNKPGRFSDAEFEIMKKHSLFSKEILEGSGLKGIAVDIAGMHHERLDGKGYPFGKKGNEISQYVRMASIVDVYDALTAERVYKAGMEPIKAFKILKEGCPDSFDPVLLTKFIQCIGIHPVGTLVKLSSQKVGLVTESNPASPLKPIVKTFYSAKHSRYTEVQDIDLANKKTLDTLESTVKPKEYNIDLERFYKNSILP